MIKDYVKDNEGKLLFDNGDKILMMGDSITDAGRNRPVAEGLFNPYGEGYPQYVNALLHAVYTDCSFRVVNMGCSGNTSRDLLQRWQTECLDLEPDWITINIGINDVWRFFDSELFYEQQVKIDEYRDNLCKMIEAAKAWRGKDGKQIKGIIMLSPHFLEANKNDRMRAMMDEYGKAAKEIADRYDTYYADTQAAFDEYLESHHGCNLAWDRIHPNNTGHMIIARTLLKTAGLKF